VTTTRFPIGEAGRRAPGKAQSPSRDRRKTRRAEAPRHESGAGPACFSGIQM
jgi:hypothetical protein